MEYIENSSHVCDYGCKQAAHYQFKNEKWCCSQIFSQCPEIRKKNSIKQKLRFEDPLVVQKQKELLDRIRPKQTQDDKDKKSKIIKKVWENPNSKYHTNEYKQVRSDLSKKYLQEHEHPNLGKLSFNRWTVKKIIEKYPFFYKLEKPTENSNGEILAECKFCKKKFVPSYESLRSRMNAVERPEGNDGLFLYCSNHCKNSCPLYRKTAEQLIKHDLINAGHIEENSILGLEIWRNEVLKRNKDLLGHEQCEICGEIHKLIAHHIYPQKSHPEMALDPDNGLIVCPECHLKKCHPKGTSCSYGELAKLRCENRYRERKELST